MRRSIASAVASVLLITAPGLPCYQAAAQVVTSGAGAASVGVRAQTGTSGLNTTVGMTSANAGLRPVLPLALSLAGAHTAPVPVPTAAARSIQAAAQQAFLPAVLPALAAPAQADAAQTAAGGRFETAQVRVDALKTQQDSGIGRTLQKQGATADDVRSAAARDFDASKDAGGISATETFGKDGGRTWTLGLKSAARSFYSRIDASHEAEVPAPSAAKPSSKVKPLAIAGAVTGLLVGGAAAVLLGAISLKIAVVASIISVALGFEFLNGMHDAANSIATVVATKTLTARQAIGFAAFFNSIAYFIFGAHIAAAIGTGLIVPAVMSNVLLVAALLGASGWNWLTVRLGIPVSSSHSLIGGLVGAALAAGGLKALLPATLLKTAAFMVVSPVVGLTAAFILMALINLFFKKDRASTRSDKFFAGTQLLSSAMLSMGHGGNDSQKTIGIITALLFANGFLGATFHVPWFVAMACYLAMGLGTLAGGWRVIKTLGEKVTKLDRPMGTAANVGAAGSIMLSTWLGIPVSTTHVVTGAVTGVGAAQNGTKSVKWDTLRKIAWAWVLTIPLSAISSGLLFLLLKLALRAF